MIGHLMLNERRRNRVQCVSSWHKLGLVGGKLFLVLDASTFV